MAKVPCPPSSSCSLLGNTDFELPNIGIPNFSFEPKDNVPCWDTDNPSFIEIWSNGFSPAAGPRLTPTALTSQAYSGTQWVELNSTAVAPFFQTFTVGAGGATGLTLTFAHAGRTGCNGNNKMQVKLLTGAGSGGAILFTAPGNRPGNIYDSLYEPDGITIKDTRVWTLYTVVLPFIPAGVNTLTFNAVPEAGFSADCGNFLDAINIGLQPPTVTASVDPVNAGGTIDLSAVNSTDVVSWEWTDPLGNVIGTAQSISVGPAVFPTDEGTYCCKVTNSFGCTATSCVDVKITQIFCYRIIDCLGIQPDFITNTDMSDYIDKTIRICYYSDSVDSDDCIPVPPDCPHWPKGCYCVTVEQVSVGCTSCPLEALIEAVYCDCEECLPKTYFQLLDCCTKEPYMVAGVPFELSFNGFKYPTGPYPSDIDHRILTNMVIPTGSIIGCYELTIVDFNEKSVYNRWETTVQSAVTVAECSDCQVCKKCYILTDCTDPSNTLVVGEDLSALIGHVITIEGCKDICWIVSEPVPNCVTTSNTTTTTNTTSTTTNSCCWNNVLVLQSATISILINTIPTPVPSGTAAAMQTYLNGLGLGAWTVTDLGLQRFTFCVTGTDTYGNMTVTSVAPKVIVPVCTSTTDIVTDFVSTEICNCTGGCTDISTTNTTTVVDTQSSQFCCWIGGIKDASQTVSIIINGVTIPIPFTLPSVDIFTYLNGLGLGTFSGIFTGFVNDPFNLCVTGGGTNIYGNMPITGPTANGFINYTVPVTCNVSTTTTTTNSTYITCLCGDGNPPVDPCIGCTPDITILSDFPPIPGDENLCQYDVPNNVFQSADNFYITIDGVSYTVPYTGTNPTQLLLSLNALNLGLWYIISIGATFTIGVTGDHVYGQLCYTTKFVPNNPTCVDPICSTYTQQCAYEPFPGLTYPTGIVEVTINGITYNSGSIPIFTFINWLNSLGLGTFGITITTGLWTVYVTGPNLYGDIVFLGGVANPELTVSPTCRLIGSPNCAACLPEPPPPIPFTLHPRKIKPGYDTPGCDPEYTQKVTCTFGEQVYDEMVKSRYGVTICCDHDIQKWNIKKQLLDLRAIYDPSLCKNLIPPCPTACPPVCPIVPIVCYCFQITHLTAGQTTYEYIQCDGTLLVVQLTMIDEIKYVCAQKPPLITIISNGTERSTITQIGVDCVLDGDCIPCTIWDCRAPGATDATVTYIDCQGAIQSFLLPAATATSVCARFVDPIGKGFVMNTGVPCP